MPVAMMLRRLIRSESRHAECPVSGEWVEVLTIDNLAEDAMQ